MCCPWSELVWGANWVFGANWFGDNFFGWAFCLWRHFVKGAFVRGGFLRERTHWVTFRFALHMRSPRAPSIDTIIIRFPRTLFIWHPHAALTYH